MLRKKILVVDDDAVVQRALSVKLHAAGYDVLVANDGAEAMGSVRQNRPDLILLDVIFPPDVAHGGGVSWDGFLLLAWLRRMDEARDIPVVMISGDDSPEQIQRARAAGANGFFPKPINYDGLVNTLAQILGEPVPQPA
ncbi:MAG TPA: response regulator [Candidatus Binatia bacterium]|jgi:CheY-like chemotaxis protein|nr:response regulator [Candidatus Binatia bacterium]